MSSAQYAEYPGVVVGRGFSWSGIFAGTFLFLAVEATFGVLGAAIFGLPLVGARNPVGIGVWMVILSIIALYFAGKLASKVSGAVSRNIGMYDGLVTFGMSIFAALLITEMSLRIAVVGAAGSRLADSTVGGGYWLFLALILAGIAAASGGIHGAWASEKRQPPLERSVEPRKVA